MKTTALNTAFEVNVSQVLTPTSIIAVIQSINTLATGEVLKVTACSKNTVIAVISFCKNSGNTLLQKSDDNNEATLFIKKN